LLLIASIGFGAGLAVSSLVGSSSDFGWVSRFALWAGMAVPIVIALRRSIPRGLFSFKKLDLLYGLALGLVVRVVQGWLSADAGAAGLPSIPLGNGSVSAGAWIDYGLSPVVVAPIIEELFFRSVVMVSVFVVLMKHYRRKAALFAAATVATALFVIAHTVTTTSTWDQIVALVLLGGVCAALVATTGRIWAAVIVHAGYNALFAALAVIGTIASTM
jgi:membrane protease YdiL (CAAX protease family)